MSVTTSSSSKKTLGEVAGEEIPVLYRVAVRLTLNPTSAEDLVGQTLLKAHQNWEAFDGRHPRSWLIAILRNEWSNQRRKDQLRSTLDLEEVGEPSDEGFWKEVSESLEVGEILSALDELPEDYRMAITLCDIEEATYEEAARALEVPVGTIRSRVFRGRKLLRSRLAYLNEEKERLEP